MVTEFESGLELYIYIILKFWYTNNETIKRSNFYFWKFEPSLFKTVKFTQIFFFLQRLHTIQFVILRYQGS